MAGDEGPWTTPRRRDARVAGWRLAVWVFLLVGAVIVLLTLSRYFPGSARSDFDRVYLVRNLAILAIVSAGVVFAPRVKFSEVMRNVAIWSAVAAVLVIGYTYRAEIDAIGIRIRAELVPSYPWAIAPHTLSVTRSEDGSFYVMGSVNGVPVRFLVDTGASDIVLSPADARRAGIEVSRLAFSHRFETAHGVGYGAITDAASLAVGPIALQGVKVSVNQSEMSMSLLGLTFLNRLDSFEIRGDRLLLRWRSGGASLSP